MLLRRVLVAVSLIVVCCGGAQAQRLPPGVRPDHYSLTITPDLAKARFTGSETIDVVLDAPTDKITLNAAEIEFGVVTAQQWPSQIIEGKQMQVPFGDDKKSYSAKVTLDAANEQATFTFPQPLAAGPATLEIAYSGILNDKLRGFYLSKTKLRSYGVTQFEATDARRAFPSFDEPALKATFNVTLVVDAGDTAISNTKIVRDTPGPVAGKHTIAFAATPKMSTYLVAWLVGDFQCSEGKSDGIPIRVCATPDKLGLTKFALDAARWDLHYYDKYFGIKYPLAKLDLVAIPDFDAGAMENFGCITFRETELLVDKKQGGLDAKKEVAGTVAHEMAHQWFGDLVTPAWWDNIWLNEGFATWMENKAPAVWQPKWEYPQNIALEKDRTMDDDAGSATRAIRTRAETPAEIDEMFDDIAYGKAGAVIGMVESWVGDEVFRKGVQTYLAAHAYGNATGEDFWDALTRVSGLPVDKVMQSFVDQPGVPLVMVRGDGAGASVTQKRFFLTAPSGPAVNDVAWTIPVCFTGASCRLLTPAAPMELQSAGVYANAGAKGYYRTAYSPELLKQVEREAETALSVPERIELLGDQWALMRASQGTVGDFLNLVLAVKQDSNAAVMDLALGKLGAIESEIATADDRKRLDAVVLREFAPVYAALGTPGKHETFDHAQLRETLFEELGRAGDPTVLAEANAVTKQVFTGHRAPDPTIADAAVSLATAKGDAAMYDAVMKVNRAATDPDLKEAALNALTDFHDPELEARTLAYAVSEAVRSQDSWTLIAMLLERPATQDLAWQFVQEHWGTISSKSTLSSGQRIVEATGSFCTVEKRDEVASFFRDQRVGSSERTLRKAIDSIDGCIHLRAAQESALHIWLDEQKATP